jgi:hypothetical protein
MSDPNGGTFIDIPKLLIDEEFMKSKLKYVTDQQVLDFWTKEFPASQRSSEAGEVISWVVSKFGPFISNDAMRNIIGQQKSGFNFADIMNNNKILLVNLSKGKMGDLNSKLLGIIFVMKFQAAAMARANMPEDERKDFTMYVDEFQNFATDSFETILSEARKYRLSLVLGNQFMTQLKEDLREAIIGNVGTTITGRIGITDAEIMVKRYTPVFDAEDLTKLPNYESVVVAQIEGVPSAPFSMSWIPPMGQSNQQLSDALKRLSSAKYGRPRGQVEQEIFQRLTVKKSATVGGVSRGGPRTVGQGGSASSSGSSFLDEWLAKRKQMTGGVTSPQPAPQGGGVASGVSIASPQTPAFQNVAPVSAPLPAQAMQQANSPQQPQRPEEVHPEGSQEAMAPTSDTKPTMYSQRPSLQEEMAKELESTPAPDKLTLRGQHSDNEVSIKLH